MSIDADLDFRVQRFDRMPPRTQQTVIDALRRFAETRPPDEAALMQTHAERLAARAERPRTTQ